jgi:hypothetical protein
MKLGTHKERMAALESAFEAAISSSDKASIVLAAAQIDRENFYQTREESSRLGQNYCQSQAQA